MQKFIRPLSSSKRKNLGMRTKDWFRAYFNLGLLNYTKGDTRPLPCGAGTDSFFLVCMEMLLPVMVLMDSGLWGIWKKKILIKYNIANRWNWSEKR